MSPRWARVLGLCLALGAGVVGRAAAQESALPGFPSGPPVSASTEPVRPAYVYPGERLRDPFIPLSGGSGGAFDMGPVVEVGPFNPAGAELKGVLRTPSGRWAVLRSQEGATYMVQNGKIFDPKRKPVDGYRAIVKEKSVVLLGPNKLEVELRLKKGLEEEP